MAKNFIEKDTVHRIAWEIMTNTLPYAALFLTGIFLIDAKVPEDLSFVMVSLLAGLFLNAVFSLRKVKFFKLIGNILPFLFCLSGTLIAFNLHIPVFLNFYLVIFLGYSITNSIGQEIFEYADSYSLPTAFIHLLIKLNRVFWFLIGYFFISELKSEAFMVTNIASLIIEMFSAVLLLFDRTSKLQDISFKLREISSWSIDHRVLEKELMKNKNILKHTNRVIVFGDIRGFTSFSEKHDIKKVVNVLTQLYEMVESKIKNYNGFKPEFIADEFVTFFENSTDAVKCAKSLSRNVNDLLASYGLSFGMGIHKGPVLEGIVGGVNSKKYTVLGKAVNTAARLQQKADGRQIFISREIVNDVQGLIASPVPGLVLKGVDPNFEVFNFIDLQMQEKVVAKKKGFFGKIGSMFSRTVSSA